MNENKKTIALFLIPGPNWNPKKGIREQEYWDEHARFVDDLFERGVIMLAGPFAPEGTGALVILNVASAEEARAIYATDPWAHQGILLTADAREWTIFLDSRKRSSCASGVNFTRLKERGKLAGASF